MLNQQNDGSFNLNIFDSPENAASSLAQQIIDQTLEIIEKQGSCVWAVSGGSTITKLYDALLLHDEALREICNKLTVIWVDERVVPHTHQDSNFGSAYNYFWSKYKDANLIPVPYQQDAEEAAKVYDSVLSENGVEPGNVDITILGMGTDGHTASLFPGNSALMERNKKIVFVEDSSVQQPRVSLTFPFINSSRHIYLLFYGAGKAHTFQQAVNSGSVDDYPVLGIKRANLGIYIDQDLTF
ncbi:6-phosphogluconolactonase [Rhodohalobacter sp. 614A]|uniref:6-phosphogluconolactonase n=1 Tax=Rhodohalobacter sp. 614A TaxID=2908649 RepID=UPI001F3EA443|nr:6-phosphogluconolactonase [Rhodohalobacter sp. 614A]